MVTNDDCDLSDVALSVIGCLVIEVSKSKVLQHIYNGFLEKGNKMCVAIIEAGMVCATAATPHKVYKLFICCNTLETIDLNYQNLRSIMDS